MFPNRKAFALLTIGSDHNLILLSLFLQMVKREEQCQETVKEVWNNQHDTHLPDEQTKQGGCCLGQME